MLTTIKSFCSKSFLSSSKSRKQWLSAQQGEYAFWKGVAETGYNDLSPDDFISIGQRDWLLGQLEFLGKPQDSWKDSVVVEFGPGPAGIIEYIDARERYGVEPLIDKYRADYPHLQTSNVTYYGIPAEEVSVISSGSADLVICFNMLDHTIDPEKVLKELHRIAKPEAAFLFQVNLYREKNQILKRPPEHAALHPHTFVLDEMLETLEKNGLKVLKSHCRQEPTPCGEYYFIAAGVVTK
jgi:SAM-dependent methyltransferase